MSETTNNALIEILDTVKKGVDFSIEQLPDIVKQLLYYNTAVYSAWFIFSIIGLILTYKLHKHGKVYEYNVGPYHMMVGFIGITSIIVFIANIFNLLKITLAPKVWLIEYTATLLQNHH